MHDEKKQNKSKGSKNRKREMEKEIKGGGRKA